MQQHIKAEKWLAYIKYEMNTKYNLDIYKFIGATHHSPNKTRHYLTKTHQHTGDATHAQQKQVFK